MQAGQLKTRVKECLQGAAVGFVKLPPVRVFYSLKLRQLAHSTGPVCLHLGSGVRRLPGFINIDLMPSIPMPDALLDLERPLPAGNGTVDFVFSEDLIEHLSYEGGRKFIKDCHRVLKPGGVMRVVTPDLVSFAKAYLERSEKDLAWYKDVFGLSTYAEMFNAGMRAWGHQFIYDEETLTKNLQESGFTVKRCQFNESEHAQLRGIDLRDTAEGAHSMYIDAVKPR